jgi:hypothetical protein
MTSGFGLSFPEGAIPLIAADVRSYGERSLETGGFLLTPVGGEVVSVVALAGERGIVRHRELFQISERALDRIFTHADDHELHIPVQFHSHRLGAFLSWTDASHGLCVADFVSVVIPGYREPTCDVQQWGWWQFGDRRWKPIAAPRVTPGTTSFVRFDEDGVRDD